jgi:alpha-L-rhamnosidase
VRIAPNLGELLRVSARMPHPKGEIKVKLERDGSRLKAQIELPPDTPGALLWEGREQQLHPGKNSVKF